MYLYLGLVCITIRIIFYASIQLQSLFFKRIYSAELEAVCAS